MASTNRTVGDLQANRRGFTMLELLVVIAIVAVLVASVVFYVQQYITYAHLNSDHQSLTVLNDALTRYKTQGGGTSGLTYGCQISGVLSRMQHAITWGGMGHRVMQTGVTYPGRSIAATGTGAQYHFTRFNTYQDADYVSGDEAGNALHGVQSYTTAGSYSWKVPAGITSVEVLVVGGGGGMDREGGGGGGGGLVHNMAYSVTPGNSITLTVGAAGPSGWFEGTIGSGGNSTFDNGSIIAYGGGGGGNGNGGNGSSGGSGGGGYSGGYSGGSGIGGQGNSGGSGGANTGPGGGGGAGAAGQNGIDGVCGGNGGDGLQIDITRTPAYYAGGGGGDDEDDQCTATDGLGTIGGGAGNTSRGAGDGCVIIKY